MVGGQVPEETLLELLHSGVPNVESLIAVLLRHPEETLLELLHSGWVGERFGGFVREGQNCKGKQLKYRLNKEGVIRE